MQSPYPGSHRLSRLAFESISKCIVTAVTTLQGQLLGSDGTLGIDSLVIETDKMVDTQIIDVGIVSRALIRKILAEIVTVSSNSLGKLENGEVVL